jgi:LPS export ABC transporter protein LptC
MQTPYIQKNLIPALFFAALFCFGSCGASPDQELSELTEMLLPDQESWNSSIIISHKGNKRAVIQAAHMRKFENQGDIHIDGGMIVDFFNTSGEHVSKMTSDSGYVNEIREHLTAVGDVVLISDTGYTAKTDWLLWRNDSNLVFTDAPVELYSATDTLYGLGFSSDVKLENWTIPQPTGHSYREIK